MLISLDMFISGFKDTFLNIGNGLNVEDGIFQVIFNFVFDILILGPYGSCPRDIYVQCPSFTITGHILTYLGSCSRDIYVHCSCFTITREKS